jgi:phosphonate transport system substrate-binding protein
MITAISLLGTTAAPTHQAICAYLSQKTGLQIEFASARSWQDQLSMLLAGEAQLAFLCGLLYTQHTDVLRLLAAPVMAEARYNKQPVYFSDIVVARSSSFASFADLQGARWAYNEPNSFSGYQVVLDYLAQVCKDRDYFGQWIEAGSHLAALQKVIEGYADGAAIDSIVLAAVLREQPALRGQIRTVTSIGPNPVPPVALRRDVSAQIWEKLHNALVSMHAEQEGQARITQAGIERFVAVSDEDYDILKRRK